MEINTEEDLKEILKIKEIIELIRMSDCSTNTECHEYHDLQEALEQVKEIADRNKFKGGCRKLFQGRKEGTEVGNVNFTTTCGHDDIFLGILFCPDCQNKKEIQEINEKIQNEK